MIEEEKINKRLIKEIKNLKKSSDLKNFLEEILIKEKSDAIGYKYKDIYRDMIDRAIDK